MKYIKAISRKHNPETKCLDYTVQASPDTIVFPLNDIATKNMLLVGNVIKLGEEGVCLISFKPAKPSNWEHIGDKVFVDLTEYYTKGEELTGEWFSEFLIEEVREETPHGEYGVTEHTSTYKVGDKYYEATIHNISWNRYDKQYYFIDMWEEPKVTFKEVSEEELSFVYIEGIYDVDEFICQSID